MRSFLFLLFFGCCVKESLFDILPVDNFPYLLYIVGPNVLVVNVVSMLPYVDR